MLQNKDISYWYGCYYTEVKVVFGFRNRALAY